MTREGGYLIGRIHLEGNRLLKKIMQKHNISSFTSEQGKILYQLWKENGLTPTELASRTGLALNTLSKMLQTMEVQGLVERQGVLRDKRSKRIILTELGIEVKKDAQAISKEMVDQMYKGFSSEEIDLFENQLRRILQNFQK